DITDMTPDTVIRLGDITLPAGVVALGEPAMAVVTVLMSRASVEGEGAPAAPAAATEGGESAPAPSED
ncbi:MAG: hypothetical protein ACKOQ1_00505, partial [Actinomycetota bacterium]